MKTIQFDISGIMRQDDINSPLKAIEEVGLISFFYAGIRWRCLNEMEFFTYVEQL